MGSGPRGKDEGCEDKNRRSMHVRNGLDALHTPASKKTRHGLSSPSNGSNMDAADASIFPNSDRSDDVLFIPRVEEMDASVSTSDRPPGDRFSPSKVLEAESAGNKEKKKMGHDRDGSPSVVGSGCSESEVDVRNEGRKISFFDFERLRSCAILKKGEICAVRDEFGMPRQYVQVQNDGNILSASVSFIDQPYKHSGVLHACGCWMAKTSYYSSAHIDPPTFSHIVGSRSFNSYDCNIYPRRGEVWAITAADYKTAHPFWKGSPTNQRYKMVEVLDDYDQGKGFKVVILDRVKGGYRSLFCRCTTEGSEVTVNILPRELPRFSHHVPSFRVSGKSSVDGCLDLDPSSLPPYIDEFTGSVEPEVNDNYLCLGFLDHKIRKERFNKSGSIWAAYDQHGMPRKYVEVYTKKDSHSGMVQMYELVLDPSCENEKKWHKAGLSILCGNFIKTPIKNQDQIILSHEINSRIHQHYGKCNIHPRQGSIWGIYKDRDVVQNHNLREYQIVEIVEDFGDHVTVACLVRVEGFKCLFRRKSSLASGALFWIPRNEFYRFSHHIPSYRFNKAYNEEIKYGSLILDPLLVPVKEGECFNFSDSLLLEKSKSRPLRLAIQHFIEKEKNRIYFENQKNCQQSEVSPIYVTESSEEQEGSSLENTRGRASDQEGSLRGKDNDIWGEVASRKQGKRNKNMEAEADRFAGDVPSTEPDVEFVFGETTLIKEGHAIRETQTNVAEVVGEVYSNELEVNGAHDHIILRKQCYGSKDIETEAFDVGEIPSTELGVNIVLDKLTSRMQCHVNIVLDEGSEEKNKRSMDVGNGLAALHPPASKKAKHGLSSPSNGGNVDAANTSTYPSHERCDDGFFISREEGDASVSNSDGSPEDRVSKSKILEAKSAGNKEKNKVGCDREGSPSVVGSGCSESGVKVRNEGSKISFFDFERRRLCAILKQGEMCAVRDEYGMPRQYARVQMDGNIHSASVHFINQTRKPLGALHACGSWMANYRSVHIDPAAFSHILGFRSFNLYDCHVYPRRDEVWAITAAGYSIVYPLQSPTNQRYQMVEVLDDFGTAEIMKVVCLVRVKGGYQSLFRRYIADGVELTMNIMPKDLCRFSHQVPSFRVLGNNSVDGCLDLDPSSLPPYIDDFTGNVKPVINDNFLCLVFLDLKIHKERCAKSGVIWAAYDHHGMPRKYIARDSTKNLAVVKMYELVPDPLHEKEKKWHKAGLPIACGTFIKAPIENRDQIIFSCEINDTFLQHGSKYTIYPKRGSIWGIYKDMDVVQNHNLGGILEYRIVEIVKDDTIDGITVAYLARVKGFKCLFRGKRMHDQGEPFFIPRNEFYRFSHHIPAYRFYSAYGEEIQKGSVILDPLLVPDKEGDCFNFSDSFLLEKSKSQPLSLALQHFVEKEKCRIYLENQEDCQQSEVCRIYVRESPEEQEALSCESTRGKTPILEGSSCVKDNDIWDEIASKKQDNGNEDMKVEADTFIGGIPSNEPEGDFVFGGTTLIKEGHEIRKLEANAVEIVGEAYINELEVNVAQDQITLRKQCHGSKDIQAEAFEVNNILDKLTLRMRDHGTEGIETETVKSVKKICGNENGIIHSEPCVKFHDFYDSKSDTTFEVGQIWSFYDEFDGLPRSYACINKFIPSEAKVEVTLLEPHPRSNEEMQWVEENLPMAFGTFRASKSTTTKEISSLSHRVACKEEKAIGSYYRFFPRKGEHWVIYKNWDANWTYSDWRNNLMFKLVEVVSDFTEDRGVTVAALIRVAGHEAVFERHMHEGFGLIQTFSGNELLRFSHCIPSLKLMGDEKDNISKELIKIKFSHHGL